jgi:hypothetical protein
MLALLMQAFHGLIFLFFAIGAFSSMKCFNLRAHLVRAGYTPAAVESHFNV